MESTFQSRLETFLDQGQIHIGPKGELFFVAEFVPYGTARAVSVDSQRGVRHLLMLLEANLSEDERAKEIIEVADRKYPYHLGPAATTQLEYFLQKTSVCIFKSNDVITMRCVQVMIPIGKVHNQKSVNKTPGVYQAKIEGNSIVELLLLGMSAQFKRVPCDVFSY